MQVLTTGDRFKMMGGEVPVSKQVFDVGTPNQLAPTATTKADSSSPQAKPKKQCGGCGAKRAARLAAQQAVYTQLDLTHSLPPTPLEPISGDNFLTKHSGGSLAEPGNYLHTATTNSHGVYTL